MSIRTVLRSTVAALALASAPAMAQNCAGFTDVTTAASFCPAVEWMKNRLITTGCTATTYCPTDLVNRAAMALFMNRLGNSLTPAFLPVQTEDSVAAVVLSSPSVRCATGDYAVTGYPRRAEFHGRVNLYNPTLDGDFIVEMVYTDDAPGSTAWKAVQHTASYQAMAQALTPINDVTTHPTGFLDLDVGKTYRFAMRISRNTGSNANASIFCTNIVSIGNRVSASSPFDAGEYTPPADSPPPQGRALPRP